MKIHSDNQISRSCIWHRRFHIVVKASFIVGFVALVISMFLTYPYIEVLRSENSIIPVPYIVMLPIFLYVGIFFFVNYLLNNIFVWSTLPEQFVNATISNKEKLVRIMPTRVFSGIGASITAEMRKVELSLVFRIDSGKHYKFIVSQPMYESLTEGDKGVLELKEKGDLTKFISFDKVYFLTAYPFVMSHFRR